MKNITRSTLSALALAAACLGVSGAAQADTIPYQDSGTPNAATYTFTAAADGDLVAWFVNLGRPGYDETLGVMVNGVDTGTYGLDNQTSNYGDSLDFGPVHAGDVLVFVLNVISTQTQYYSDASMNADDHTHHVYSTAYGGDVGSGIPVGVYVGFEDLDHGGDFNYSDEQFVFSNVNVGVVPEPANALLLLAGLGAVAGAARRRRRG